jgi:parvulin-like peptidyl-prolyl isomerase
MISSLERARYNIEMNDDISDEEAERIMNEIDAQIQNMNEAKQLAVEAQMMRSCRMPNRRFLRSVQSAKDSDRREFKYTNRFKAFRKSLRDMRHLR